VQERLDSISDTAFSFFELMFWPYKSRLAEERSKELFRRCCIAEGEKVVLQISVSQFNSILTEHGQPTVSREFFDYFFPGLESGLGLPDFRERIVQYMKVAIWKYGNPRAALFELGQADSLQVELAGVPIRGASPVNPNTLKQRTPFNVVTDLTPDQRRRLGYLTGADENDGATLAAREIGRKNTREYLFVDELDVYVATGMRGPEDFEPFTQFTHDVFGSKELSDLQIRFFDPTLSYYDNAVLKGLLEALMLRRAKMTLYVAGDKDTFGKDSECASTLAQGKPVVVLVEKPGPGTTEDEARDLENRAKLFQGAHPLSLQVSVREGIPRGLIVVRTVKDCVSILRQLLLHELDTNLDHDGTGYLLKERTTMSRIGVAVSDSDLSHAFQNYYHEPSEPD
jgi:hypothetical protein